MQFRWSVRKSIAVPVMIHHDLEDPMQVKTRDISLGGMFIETGSDLLCVNAPVMVSFAPSKNGHAELKKIEALVVRVTRDGVGLKFRESGDEDRLFLEYILRLWDRRRSSRIKRPHHF